jgi:hypothetical protein
LCKCGDELTQALVDRKFNALKYNLYRQLSRDEKNDKDVKEAHSARLGAGIHSGADKGYGGGISRSIEIA